MRADSVRAQLSDLNPDAMFLENMDAALIGVGYRGNGNPVAVYSRAGILLQLGSDGFTPEDVESYYIGVILNVVPDDDTPVILDDRPEAE